MSQFVGINASKAFNNGAVNVHSERFARTVYGRPMGRDEHSYQSRTHMPGQLEASATTMTPPVCRVNPSAATTKRKVVHFFLPKGDAIQLQTCKNAWVPSCLRVKDTNDSQPLNKEDKQIEEIRKQFLSILNKISPENMDQLTETILSLPIATEHCMKKVIELLFQKAIDEPNFTPQYAYVCAAMHQREVDPNDEMSETSFKKLLTKCCQDRLHKMQVHDESLGKNLKAMGDCKDQIAKKQLQSQYDQDEMVYRKRSVGNCRFMCELYKVKILTNETLEMSMKYLVKSPNEETLECICNILKHMGRTLSHEAITETFMKLKEYTSAEYKTKIPTRIRFMIQDTVELKENNWILRDARPREQFCITKAPQNTGKPPVPHIPHVQAPVIITKNTPLKPNEQKSTTLPMEIRRVDNHQHTQTANVRETSGIEPTTILISSNNVQGTKLLVSPCVGRVTQNTNNGHSSDAEKIETEEIQNKYRSIFENATPENMVQMVKSIISLPIKTDDCLQKVVGLLFQKAMDEPTLAPQCADICSLMQDIEVQSNDQKENTSFLMLLIAMCQNTFEAISTRKRMVAEDRKTIECCKDKVMRKRLQSKFDQNELNHRSRCIANCRFMCELLRVDILVDPILEMCAAQLVQSQKETSIECVCVVLKHTGTTLFHSGAFEKLHEYTSTHNMRKLSSRIQSMILDTLEMKNGDFTRYNICEKSPLLDDNLAKPPIEDIKEKSASVQPVSTSVYKTIKSVINSVTTENMNFTINELSAHISNIDVMEKAVEFIFSRANIRPESIPELVSLCSSLKNKIANLTEANMKPMSLKKQVSIRCNQILQSGVQNDSSGNGFTHKEPFVFVGELFNANVLSAHTLLDFLQILPDKLTNRALDNTCCLLKAAGKKLEQVYNLKKTIRKLTSMVSNDVEKNYSRRSSVLLKELVDLRDKKWITYCKQ